MRDVGLGRAQAPARPPVGAARHGGSREHGPSRRSAIGSSSGIGWASCRRPSSTPSGRRSPPTEISRAAGPPRPFRRRDPRAVTRRPWSRPSIRARAASGDAGRPRPAGAPRRLALALAAVWSWPPPVSCSFPVAFRARRWTRRASRVSPRASSSTGRRRRGRRRWPPEPRHARTTSCSSPIKPRAAIRRDRLDRRARHRHAPPSGRGHRGRAAEGRARRSRSPRPIGSTTRPGSSGSTW